MQRDDTKRLSRLVSILTQLQTRRLITSTSLAEKFEVSVRTIYRDIKALEQAGVPILSEDGRGYTLMEGYKIPPVMFSERQANALILAEQLVLRNMDASLIKDYSEAIDKVKALLKPKEKAAAYLLSERTKFDKIVKFERSSDSLSTLQYALTNFHAAKINYVNADGIASTERIVEPFALISTLESWLLVAFCQMRKEFRFFRLDRIEKLEILSEKFMPHKMTLKQFFEKYHGH
jgi:predicted DNA-binding transcriptional regulator YafY